MENGEKGQVIVGILYILFTHKHTHTYFLGKQTSNFVVVVFQPSWITELTEITENRSSGFCKK